MAIKKSTKVVKKLNESKQGPAGSPTDALLRDINEKIKNRNIFAWRFLFGWLLAIAISVVGFGLAGLTGFQPILLISWIVAMLAFVANLAMAVLALYKSTQDC